MPVQNDRRKCIKRNRPLQNHNNIRQSGKRVHVLRLLYFCPFCQATSDYVYAKNVRVPCGCETYTIWNNLNLNLYNHLF